MDSSESNKIVKPSAPCNENHSSGLNNTQAKQASNPVGKNEVQKSPTSPKINLMSANDLMKTEMPELIEFVKGMVVPGLTLLAGAPKAGKSWFAYALGLAVANGSHFLGVIETVKSGVLYLALEDSQRRLKNRLEMLSEGDGVSGDLYVINNWPFDFIAGLNVLRKILRQNIHIKVVIIDVLRKFCPGSPGKNIYQLEYSQAMEIKRVADEFGVAILLIHHTNKSTQTENVFDKISGTTGLSGACDSLMVLLREPDGSATLYTTGRDIEGERLCLTFDKEGGWLIADNGCSNLTPERREIVNYLEREDRPMKSGEVAAALNKNPSTTRVMLRKMVRDGHICQKEAGLYMCMPCVSLEKKLLAQMS